MSSTTFISSTWYDLKDARATLREFLVSFGHVPLMHEDAAGFGVDPAKHSHDACLDQVDRADFLILIIGGRRGGHYIASERSITNEEYNRAQVRGIPVFTFVNKSVMNAQLLYKKNPKADFSSFVDDNKIFDFIDRVATNSQNNWIFQFETVTDITNTLRGQFSHLHRLYSQTYRERLNPKRADDTNRPVLPFPSDIRAELPGAEDADERNYIVRGLKHVHAVMTRMQDEAVRGYEEKIKVLWIFGRYGTPNDIGMGRHGGSLRMEEADFKQRAWGVGKGRRVFGQLKPFGVIGEYEFEYLDEDEPPYMDLMFKQSSDGEAVSALHTYCSELAKRHGEDGIDLFQRCDLSCFREGT